MRRHQFISKAMLLIAVLIGAELSAVSQALWAANPLVIHDGFDHTHLMNQVEYLVDETRQRSVDEVSASGQKWQPLPGGGAKSSFGYSRSAFWFRFAVENPASRPITWMLEYDYPVVDYIDFFMPDTGLHFKSGDHRPFHVRPIAYRTIVFPVETPPGTHECYIRLASQGSIVLPLNAWSQAAFETKKTHDQSLMWLYYGIMLALGFYNFFIFLFIRETSYLYLVLFTLTVTLFTMAHDGHAFQLLWPNATWWASICHPIMVLLGGLTVLMFTRRFLLTKENAKTFDRLLLIVIGGGGLLVFAAPWVDYYYATQFSVLFAAVCAIAVITTGTVQLFRRQREAVFFILAWFVFIVGVLMISAKSYGFLPSNILTDASHQLGSCLVVLLLSLGLGDRMKALNAELFRHKHALEDLVRERTTELEAANQELKASMAHLKKTQDQLVQTEKMASLGGLVAGVAHEINTPIGVTVTAASFLAEKTQEVQKQIDDGRLSDQSLEKFLKSAGEISHTILNNLKRAAELIQGFKQVAVDQSAGSRRWFYIKAYLDEILLSLHPKFKRTSHTIAVTCDEDIEINSYPGVFSRIITNLVMNSLNHGFDGMENGRIDISVRRVDGRLYLGYQDNGRGMPKETLDQIFEPFFTTRRSQGGTGLGMHIVYNLVTQSLGGEIACQSEPGNGINIRIIIPLEECEEAK
ncbi:MAG: 7TM diverse intracellular signaling domain-containing protein [Desulfobacterales bacterium]